MNILQHYILNVLDTKQLNNNCIEVTVNVNCWGNIETIKHITTPSQWAEDLAHGYFYA